MVVLVVGVTGVGVTTVGDSDAVVVVVGTTDVLPQSGPAERERERGEIHMNV